MHRLVYVSRSLILDNHAELDALVRQAAAHNETVGITGMLWSAGPNFAQVLEGGETAVNDIVSRITDDPRHTDISVVYDRSVSSRMFGRWSMTLCDGSSQSIENTAFLVGLAISEKSPAARRLHDILVA